MTNKEQLLFSQIKYDYETTDESVRSLANRFNINHVKLTRIIKKESWQRFNKLSHFDEMNLLQEVEKRVHTELTLSDDVKMNSTQVINNAFSIIDKLHNVHNKSLTAIDIIIDDTLNKLKNNTIEYVDAVNILQKIGAGLDKISAFYKEPAMTNIQINNNKQEEEFNQVQFYIPEKSSI